MVEYLGGSKYRMSVGGESFVVSGSLVNDNGVRHLSASVGDSVSRVNVVLDGRDIHLFTQVGLRGRYSWHVKMCCILILLRCRNSD